MNKTISTPNAPAAIGPYSQAISAGGVLYSSGQIPLDPATGALVPGGIREQAEQIMKNLSAVLEKAGLGFEHVVKTTCFLTNMDDFAVFNEVYGAYFTSRPARSCVTVKALPKNALAEVELVAVFP